jgi:hypothetical protein
MSGIAVVKTHRPITENATASTPPAPRDVGGSLVFISGMRLDETVRGKNHNSRAARSGKSANTPINKKLMWLGGGEAAYGSRLLA